MTIIVPDFSNLRLLVAGDIMLDRYWFGPAARISPEAPVPVVQVHDREDRAGGAANVAINVAALGARVALVGATGDDEAAGDLQRVLAKHRVESLFCRLQDRPTITKLRVLSRNQQLIRLDTEQSFSSATDLPVAQTFRDALPGCDAVVLSDYAKGTLRDAPDLIAAAHQHNIPVLVDPKGRDFTRYRGATVITPNLAEFEAVAGPCPDDASLAAAGERLRQELGLRALLITRSERGMTLIDRDSGVTHLPAEAREVYDVTGAGDTVIAVLAAGLAAGGDLARAAELANLAAGLVVRKIGVASVTRGELRLALHQRGIGGRGILGRGDVLEFVHEAQQRKEKVVMTNGCFDILHAGHVAYLEEAKALGHRLVVAVNDDDSVRRLKGAGRPVTPLADRLSVLAGLAAVDWVVAFGEDTPERLICDLLPDILVKGGDYRPEDIAGGDCVRRNGGLVTVLPFRSGRSTTSTIDAIRRLPEPG